MKKEFRTALAWMRKAQTASLFVPGVSVSVEIHYTPANDYIDKEGINHAYSCQIRVHGKERDEYESAHYAAWGGMEEFEEGKEKVIALLRSYGVKI